MSFLRNIREAQLLAFSTSSSAAVMPLSMETAEKKLLVEPSIVRFIIPLGASLLESIPTPRFFPIRIWAQGDSLRQVQQTARSAVASTIASRLCAELMDRGRPLPVEKVGLESCPDETNGRREKGHADEDAETTPHEGKGAFPGVTMISAQEGRKSNNRKSEPQNEETQAGRKALN
jgi:hypothetical protein